MGLKPSHSPDFVVEEGADRIKRIKSDAGLSGLRKKIREKVSVDLLVSKPFSVDEEA